jgi:hypothetical protein
MVKKPIVANIQAMNISIKPTRITVSIEPTQNNVPAVLNDASPDFCASVWKVLFR